MKTDIPSDYAKCIQQFRAKFGLTQTELAQRMGVTPGAVSQWESGYAQPSQKRWAQLARAEVLGPHALAEDFSEGQVAKERATDYVTAPPAFTFATDPEVVRLTLEAYRLAYGYQANPTFATEISQVQPLPHQHTAVYDRMLKMPQLRFLLADDAGAGKTIMAGLYIREMLLRRLIQRVLVVPPAGLVKNWENEMHHLFSLPFQIAGSSSQVDNPFTGPESDLLIVSVDTLAGERMFARLQEPEVPPYDLVIFDEAHKLSADREPNFYVRKTNRYRLAEALAGIPADEDRWQLAWSAHHLILLTATPHMGKDYPYYCLWRLLEPDALATYEAFHAYPPEARRQHFIRRTKEEMVDFEGNPLYPERISNTLSYQLTQGPGSEQELYDQTTQYMDVYYNQARMLNRSAAKLAMSVFQRRLANSTYALLRSLENRMVKLEGLMDAIVSGEISEAELQARQRRLDQQASDPLDETTADEEAADGEGSESGREQHEAAEEQTLGGTVALNLAQLQVEHSEVQRLRDLAQRLYDDPAHEDSKFAKLLEVLRNPKYRDEKLIIFTEHRDTLTFLVRRLEQLGYTGEIAQIHGGVPYPQREAQVDFFRQPVAQGGARYLVATDAAGEGINLQFCWLMVNYDVPWNPARLEQRMGRIHRYGQQHDPVIITNLVAGETREGKVIKTLLEKLEAIGKELGRGKVFDVVGKLFKGLSLTAYMEQALTDKGADAAVQEVNTLLTKENVEAIEAQEQVIYGAAGRQSSDDPRDTLAQQRKAQALERYRRLLPGHVRRFVEQAAQRLDIAITGDLDGTFTLRPLHTGALDPLWPVLETYPLALRDKLTVYREQVRPEGAATDQAIFIRPGEAVFDRFAEMFSQRFAPHALQGSTFVDPTAEEPYLFHLLLVEVVRVEDGTAKAPRVPRTPRNNNENLASLASRGLSEQDPSITAKTPRTPRNNENLASLAPWRLSAPTTTTSAGNMIEARLVGLRQSADGKVQEVPVEHLLLLRGGTSPYGAGVTLAAQAKALCAEAEVYAQQQIAEPLAEAKQAAEQQTLPERLAFVQQGYDFREAELLRLRSHYRGLAKEGDARAKAELTRVKARQKALAARREATLAALSREPDLIAAQPVRFLVHALVMPSHDPEDKKLYDMSAELVAMRETVAYEESHAALVTDVHTPALARAAGLTDYPGFDLLSRRPDGEIRQIEVKGRARNSGKVELSLNEWTAACNGKDAYWLYAVYGCASPTPVLHRVQNPFVKKLGAPKEGWLIDKQEIVEAAED